MRTFFLFGLIYFFSVSLMHGQIRLGEPLTISKNGLEVQNHEEINAVVVNLRQDALDIGLTRSRIESRVNVRLRQVGLRPSEDAMGSLYIHIHVVDGAYHLALWFQRTVTFSVGDVNYLKTARVYNDGITGFHGRNSDNIMPRLDQLLDEFLSEYLDAND